MEKSLSCNSNCKISGQKRASHGDAIKQLFYVCATQIILDIVGHVRLHHWFTACALHAYVIS